MNILAKWRKHLLVASMIAGLIFITGGAYLIIWTSGQAEYYNLGLKAYNNGQMSQAILCFDKSIASYRAETQAGWLHRFIYPKPDKELASLAYFQKAKAHLQNRQAELASEAFKESLRLNPGDKIAELTQEDAVRLHEEAFVVKYDLEMLFKSRPDIAQQQGKGKGKGNGNGNRPAPGSEPGSQPGKGNREDI